MIPAHLKDIIHKDSFYRACCLKDDECGGRIEIHHALIYAGQQVNVLWALLPLCQEHHLHADRKDIRGKLVRLMRKRGGEEVKDYEKVQKLR